MLTPHTARWQTLRAHWKHLRVLYQMTLAPLFLWGYFLARERPEIRVLPAFFAFHFLLYTGITAYNSFYDRDEGAIGGMEHPPPVPAFLLPLALLLQGAGAVLALWIAPVFAGIYLVFMVLSVLYSHPRFRWKAHPLLSTLVVSGGQGGLGFLAGWAAARGEIVSAYSLTGILGGTAAALTTLGMYPITQVFQVEEDVRRGDRTLCVVLGVSRALRLSQAAFVASGVTAFVLMRQKYTGEDAFVLAGSYLVLLILTEIFRRRFLRLSGRSRFRIVLTLSYASSAAFLLFILLRLVRQN